MSPHLLINLAYFPIYFHANCISTSKPIPSRTTQSLFNIYLFNISIYENAELIDAKDCNNKPIVNNCIATSEDKFLKFISDNSI